MLGIAHSNGRESGNASAKAMGHRHSSKSTGGDELANRPRQPGEQRAVGDGTGQCGEQGLADTSGGGRSREGNDGRKPEVAKLAGVGACWPSRPGEPQHDWEAPRITQRGVGCPVDGVPGRVHSRANKAALRILGNAWIPQIAELIFRWIVEQEGRGRAAGEC
jgi:hypothetical protein